jgi:hypothetical protein
MIYEVISELLLISAGPLHLETDCYCRGRVLLGLELYGALLLSLSLVDMLHSTSEGGSGA